MLLKLQGLILAASVATIAGFSAHADVAINVKVSQKSYTLDFSGIDRKMQGKPDVLADLLPLIDGVTDPRLPMDEALAAFAFEQWQAQRQMDDDKASRYVKSAKENAASYSKRLQEFFEAIANKNGAKIHTELTAVKKDGVKTGEQARFKLYSFPDGVGFFRDYYRSLEGQDPIFRSLACAFLSSTLRQKFVASDVEKAITTLHDSFEALTFLFSAHQWQEIDLQKLLEITKGRSYQYVKVGDTWVFGSGFSFTLTKRLIEEGQQLTDPKLKARFEKIVRYHEAFAIPVTHAYQQGAAAYFTPIEEKMAFVLPSQGNMNSYTHEMTHSRFAKFTQRLDSWTKSKGYVVPYQIDGPGRAGMAALIVKHGGLFNLLNEVNSWRIGESFEGKEDDAKILETLVASYGQQAGYEATSLLKDVWTPEKLAGKSVPYLIYDEIRRFNKMTDDELLYMGLEGAEQGNLVKKMNFLIMYKHGRFNDSKVKADAEFVLNEIRKSSREASVVQALAELQPSRLLMNQKIYLTFGSVLDDFVKTGNPTTVQLLTTKLLPMIAPQHIDRIVERGTKPPASDTVHEATLVLTKLFMREGIIPLVNEDPKTGQLATREPAPEKTPFLTALDLSLSQRLFNGELATPKFDLVNLIAMGLHPTELPLTYQKALELLKAPRESVNKEDRRIASLFFYPASESTGASGTWAEALIKDLKGVELHSRLREAMAVHYQRSTAPLLANGGVEFGTFSTSQLNKETRTHTLKMIERLSPENSARLENASEHLWELSRDPEATVRIAALYAMLSNPMFVIRNEGRIILALQDRAGEHRDSLEFLVEVAGGVIPDAARIYANQKEAKDKRATELEKAFSGLGCYDLFK